MDKKSLLRLLFLAILTVVVAFALKQKDLVTNPSGIEKRQKAQKLYWFIPDGMRAEPDLFNVYQWAQEGKLPNIKKMIENGVFGYSIPTFPSHTPTNFATLLTGAYPKTHGVADGPMHIEGKPLDKPSLKGFASGAKKVAPAWKIFEDNDKKVALLSIPGSTPPELKDGITVRGRWSGWGADTDALIFEPEQNLSFRKRLGLAARLFFLGSELTRFVKMDPATGWENPPVSYSPALESDFPAYGANFYAYIFDSTDDGKINYDKVSLSKDKKEYHAALSAGQWSDWQNVELSWKNNDQVNKFDSNVKFELIRLKDNGVYRIRLFFNNLNKYIADPSEVAKELTDNVGPMVDFVDNFPAQLIYYPEDKKAFLDEANMSLEWHKKAAGFMIDKYSPDVFINDTYTPNQMLTTKWWLGYIDPKSKRYNDVSKEERDKLWEEVKDMYVKLDDIVGEMLKRADENTLVVLSSDHGAIPLDKYVKINNLLAKKGWLKFKINEQTGEPVIDWAQSKAIYLKMYNIYISPSGLGGNWKRSSGAEYEALRNEVRQALLELKDSDGTKPVIQAINWEDAKFLELPEDRVGDLIITNNHGYGWSEEMDNGLEIFSEPLITGYKQAINSPRETKGIWAPFIIMGPGIKKNYVLKEPINMVDQLPTILTSMGIDLPKYNEGRVLEEALER